ncbi:MAG: DNA translocase FtsK [Candidatus Omnitrophica bacterium]|nr:DNA translocase FtsK [Candidatus Omnitrophota bacterium]
MLKAQRRNELWACALLAAALFLAISLLSYDVGDTALRSSPANSPTLNRTGVIGAYLSEILILFFGKSAFLVPLIFFVWSLSRFLGVVPPKLGLKLFGFFVLLFSASAWTGIGNRESGIVVQQGGVCGLLLSSLLTPYFGMLGSRIVVGALLALSLLLATEFLFVPFFLRVWKLVAGLIAHVREEDEGRRIKPVLKIARNAPRMKGREEAPPAEPPRPARPFGPLQRLERERSFAKPIIKPPVKVRPAQAARREPVELKSLPAEDRPVFTTPSPDILSAPPQDASDDLAEDLAENSRVLEGTLSDFGIEARVVQVNQGPVITRYELLPAPGVKVGRITALTDDIALAMKAQSVRIVAPIPGKAAVGIEVPNMKMSLVYLQEILRSEAFAKVDSKLAIALGKEISGSPLVADLAEMPHLMIAGTTGSGKTVCVNAIIASILFNATPEDVRFIMVDPKMVELVAFNKLPHLACPVVTDAKKVAAALSWVVQEMEDRYRLLASSGVRDIQSYNRKGPERKLPYIVVVIDELADLMLVAADKIEGAITRLAQLARAVGIHMVLATQRPSVDVITGVIKANFPARLSFKVASKVDSRTVMDMGGADKLLGKGDLLFLRPGQSKPVRGQGALVSDEEIARLIESYSSQGKTQYEEALMERLKDKEGGRGETDRDELFDDAVRVILDTGQASTSMLQRRLKLGYTRAARIIDEIEQAGYIGPSRGAKPRDILISDVPPEGAKAAPLLNQGANEKTDETLPVTEKKG